MSIISDINTLEIKKSMFDSIISQGNMDIENKYKLEILKEEMLNILTNIFSTYSSHIFSTTFYLQVNKVESKICELITKKNEELLVLSKEKDITINVSRRIISSLYSISNLMDNIHVGMNIEKRLLDIKNDIINLNICSKKDCALNYIEKKLPIYVGGLKSIIKIVYEYKDKKYLPFEKKQDIFQIMKNISLENQITKSHSKMFNEDLNLCDNSTTDYIMWYENIFLENCDTIGLNINSYYLELVKYIQSKDISLNAILSFVDEYIFNKYNSDILLYHSCILKNIQKSNDQIKYQLKFCYNYNENFEFNNIIEKFEYNCNLSEVYSKINNKDLLKNIISNLKISIKNNIILFTTLDRLNELLFKNFNYDDYLKLYHSNIKYKNRQIGSFRQYYIDILEKSKKDLIQEYIAKINNDLNNIKNDNCIIDNKLYNTKKDEIEELNHALSYISSNYRDFNDNNLKIYLNSIEKKYNVKNLYEKISAKSSNLIFKLKTKIIIKNDLPYIESFINSTDLLDNLTNTIIQNIIISNKLKEELLKYV